MILFNASVSIEKSFLNGVTRATPVPINDCIMDYILFKIFKYLNNSCTKTLKFSALVVIVK